MWLNKKNDSVRKRIGVYLERTDLLSAADFAALVAGIDAEYDRRYVSNKAKRGSKGALRDNTNRQLESAR